MSRILNVTLSVIFALAATLTLSACANKFDSDVARFHRLPKPSGETFVIVPNDKAKVGSLEFAQYASEIAKYLTAYGYRPTDKRADAQLIVKVDYSIGGGNTVVRSYPSAFGYYPYGYGYGYGYGYYSPYYWPYYPPDGYANEVRSYIVYNRKLTMTIETPSGDQLFDGRVESQGQDNRLPVVMPYLVKAMFADFPGESGVSQHVVIKEDGGDGY